MAKTIKIPKVPKKKPYRSPPRHTQFKPGQSGNPKGRPKGSKNLKTLFEKELNKKVTVTQDGKKVRLTKKELLPMQLINDALKGNKTSMKMVIELMLSQEAVTQEATTGQLSIPDLSPEALGRVGERLLRKARAIDDENPDEGDAA